MVWCYDSKLGSDCKLGKDLSKSRKDNQLPKHKNIELYLLPTNHKKIERHSWGDKEKKIRKPSLLYETLTDII